MGLKYKPDGEVLKAFILDESFVSVIRGPVGSGKSVGSCIKLMRYAHNEQPNENGVRRARFGVIRNTNPQLRTTTIKTWLEWFPEDIYGQFKWSVPYTHQINVKVDGKNKKGEDIGEIDVEVIFVSADKPEDVRKLLSLDLTALWINEGREVEKDIVDAGTTRVGRFPMLPEEREGYDDSNYGVIIDTNAPEDDHWIPVMAGDAPVPEYISEEERLMLVKPDDWKFFNQPGGMVELMDEGKLAGYDLNPLAENQKYLRPSYYPKLIQGKRKSWIDVYVLNKLGATQSGKVVYPEFVKEWHVASKPLAVDPMLHMYLGVDFGNTPACQFLQQQHDGQWWLIDELITGACKIQDFARIVMAKMAKMRAQAGYSCDGDPTGKSPDQQQSTSIRLCKAQGLKVHPCETNDPTIRVETVASVLNRSIQGKPGLLISPKCTTTIKGFEYGYNYRRKNVIGAVVYEDKPNKNSYSHPHDALQYALIGAGEGRALLTNKAASKNKKPSYQMKRGGSPWKRQTNARASRGRL